MDEVPQDVDLETLSLRASGTFDGCVWEFRADILNGEAHTWVEFRDAAGSGAGGGGVGALPLQEIGWKTTGHIGTVGWSRGASGRKGKSATPNFLCGVVSDAVGRIDISLSDGSVAGPTVVDAGNAAVRFFVLPFSGGLRWREIVARDAAGRPLDLMLEDSWPV